MILQKIPLGASGARRLRLLYKYQNNRKVEMLNNYIKTARGAVTIVRSLKGLCLMVDTRETLRAEDWDSAIAECWRQGYTLASDEPTNLAGFWEFWEMHPYKGAA